MHISIIKFFQLIGNYFLKKISSPIKIRHNFHSNRFYPSALLRFHKSVRRYRRRISVPCRRTVYHTVGRCVDPVLKFRIVGLIKPVNPVIRHFAGDPGICPYNRAGGRRQLYCSFLAHHLAIDVIAEFTVDKYLHVNTHPTLRTKNHKLRVLQMCACVFRSRGKDNLGGCVFLACQPAKTVYLMNQRIMNRHLSRIGICHRRISVRTVNHQRLSQLSFIQFLFELSEPLIIPPVKTHLDQMSSRCDFCLHDFFTVFCRCRQWFFTKNPLSGRYRF